MKILDTFIVAIAIVAIASCGGGGDDIASNGGGVGSGGTGISGGGVGYVAGFGSIYVNGTRFDIDNATVTLADDTALKLGMTVKAVGMLQTDFLKASASTVVSAIDVRGPVSNLNAASSTLQVHGLNVSTDSETIYEGINSLAGLANADWVKIYGHVWGVNNVRASRIEKFSAASTLILSGAVSGLNTGTKSFTLGNLTIQYGGASFSNGVTAGSLSNGVVVRVRSTTLVAGTVLSASSIEAWYPLPSTNNTGLSISGVITSYVGLGNFSVLGYPVDASAAVISGGPVGSMGDGVKIEVAGTVQGGVLRASKVMMRQIPGTGGPAKFTATGPIALYVSAASFTVQGQPIDASGGSVTFSGGTLVNLRSSAKVTVVGSHVVSGVLIADSVTFVP
ncbi:MAG: hypothetical protein RL392_701 [Pseudomonadota bacterium]|jgi:hypothetical protein